VRTGQRERYAWNPSSGLFEFARIHTNPGHKESFTARGNLNDYFACTEGHGAPQGAQAPAKSSGETGRPLDGDVRCSATSAAKPTKKTTA
jgi:hypothetical protein